MTRVPPADIFTRRVCLTLEGADAVSVHRDLAYGPPDRRLCMDVYHPTAEPGARRWPAVILVSGYPGATNRPSTVPPYKQMGWTISMAELIALSGMMAIAYTNQDAVADLHALVEHLHQHAESLRIDAERIGVLAVSGNVPAALTTVMRSAARPAACAVFGYGCLLDLDEATGVADAARQFGFANPNAGCTLGDLRPDVPLLITRAGRDQFPAMNASIDRFVRHALEANLKITLINHAEGPHAFDLFDDSDTSRDIVRQTLRFLRQHLRLAVNA